LSFCAILSTPRALPGSPRRVPDGSTGACAAPRGAARIGPLARPPATAYLQSTGAAHARPTSPDIIALRPCRQPWSPP